MYCADSRHFAASCPRKLKDASGQVEITPFEDSGNRKEVEKPVEKGAKLGKVLTSAIRMAIALDTNLLCPQLLSLILEYCCFQLIQQKLKNLQWKASILL
jgi:hypothetical protein